jgi:hypothetical protein
LEKGCRFEESIINIEKVISIMAIDLTGPEEQDWLGGERGPPIEFSEMLSEEEVLENIAMEFIRPLSEEIKPRLSPEKRSEFAKLEQSDYELISMALLYLVDDSQFEELLNEVERDLKDTGDSGQEFVNLYTEETISRFLNRIKPIQLRLIARYLVGFKEAHSQSEGPDGQSELSGSHTEVQEREFEAALQILYKHGIERIELAAA